MAPWRLPAPPARELLARASWLELAPIVLARALGPFPLPLRTLDALHLGSLEYLRAQRLEVSLAAYDERMAVAATRFAVPLTPL